MSEKLTKVALALAGIGISLWIITNWIGKILSSFPIWLLIVAGVLFGSGVLYLAFKALLNLQERHARNRAIYAEAHSRKLEAQVEYSRAQREADELAVRREALELQKIQLQQKSIEASQHYHIQVMQLQMQASRVGFDAQGLYVNGVFTELPATQIKMLEASRQALPPGKAPVQIGSGAITVPGEYDLMDVVKSFPLSTDRLFLGRTGDGRNITVDSEKQLCHGAFNAITGRGKTILVRGIETQLLKFGHEVIHADIKFSLIDEKGNDYKPIAKGLLDQGAIAGTNMPHLLLRPDHIFAMVSWLAGDELERRLALYNQGYGAKLPVIYLFLEELAYLIALYGKDFAAMVGKILVVGRSLGVKVFTAAQNFQVQNLGINSGMRENFETAYYLGGDDKSGASLLDISEKEMRTIIQQNSINLGKGVTFFRNNTVAPDATIIRAGMASNDFVYHLLGRADDFRIPASLLPGKVVDTDPIQPAFPVGHGTRDTQETRHNDNLTVFPTGRAFTGHVPNEDASGLVKPVEAHPVNVPFVPMGEDKLLPDDKHEELAYWYGKVGNVHAALAKMGITNSRYRRHAAYIVEEMGLKARRA